MACSSQAVFSLQLQLHGLWSAVQGITIRQPLSNCTSHAARSRQFLEQLTRTVTHCTEPLRKQCSSYSRTPISAAVYSSSNNNQAQGQPSNLSVWKPSGTQTALSMEVHMQAIPPWLAANTVPHMKLPDIVQKMMLA